MDPVNLGCDCCAVAGVVTDFRGAVCHLVRENLQVASLLLSTKSLGPAQRFVVPLPGISLSRILLRKELVTAKPMF